MEKYDLRNFKEVFGGFENSKILNLGCGDNLCVELSMVLQKSGGLVTGIDICDADSVPYKHIVADLTQKKLSGIVNANEFDVVIAHSFFDSWNLREIMKKNKYESVYDRERLDRWGFFVNGLVNDISVVLKDSGSFVVGPMTIPRDIIDYNPKRALMDSGFRKDSKKNVGFLNGGFVCEKYDKKYYLNIRKDF